MELPEGARKAPSKKKHRKHSPRGKRGDDASEKLVAGNGWTLSATQKFLDCKSTEEQIQQLLLMFSIQEEDYQYNEKSTTLIDFQLGNGLYCIEKKFNAEKTQFVCRTFHRMLKNAVQKIQANHEISYDDLRNELFNQFQAAFTEMNSNGEPHFTLKETQDIINYEINTFLRPLRLILHPFYIRVAPTYRLELKKVFQPVDPIPLSEFEEFVPLNENEFPLFSVPINEDKLNLEDIKEFVSKYTDGVIDTINKRYDALDERMNNLKSIASPASAHKE
ncbi:hypothetical protein GPJ56_009164 [Histomonas meleagridis]|uniref:uncharacterized protein n=1 Tax=Histomonas meleagridis TaxID=135588 RepID=UPI003559AAE8|nr:hypothetical protein GPJ56_009164 [Histomonas meleagridis]KAH0799082.1 hypothetical protein GO595_007879 [Histomonas meleagridis]